MPPQPKPPSNNPFSPQNNHLTHFGHENEELNSSELAYHSRTADHSSGTLHQPTSGPKYGDEMESEPGIPYGLTKVLNFEFPLSSYTRFASASSIVPNHFAPVPILSFLPPSATDRLTDRPNSILFKHHLYVPTLPLDRGQIDLIINQPRFPSTSVLIL
ncbi:hypothetical protein CROQUDRAFT_87442 [Cronartium quercuum f. sp. fusiforme G11]|uniref:Uncharacterized protein n=1 Tax=Cronartium quercuum f. sp. fusiforme G11 TaxID=708437 RepID=A0A9P6NVJ7_9BASI|nr:hypothetical protein CROQUDRAFT_87442 [Cronartium quercuum f. sp. fusiforme G11]